MILSLFFSGYYTENKTLVLPSPQGHPPQGSHHVGPPHPPQGSHHVGPPPPPQGPQSISPQLLHAIGSLQHSLFNSTPPGAYQAGFEQLQADSEQPQAGSAQLQAEPLGSGQDSEGTHNKDDDDDTSSSNSDSNINNYISNFVKDIPPSKKRGRPPKTSLKSPPLKKKKNVQLDFLPSDATTFDSLATDVVHLLAKPHKIPHHMLLHLHLHMKEHMSKLIKHTSDELNEVIDNFTSNAKLIMASLAHNYSDAENYPCLNSSSSSELKKELFEMVRKFENGTPSTPTP